MVVDKINHFQLRNVGSKFEKWQKPFAEKAELKTYEDPVAAFLDDLRNAGATITRSELQQDGSDSMSCRVSVEGDHNGQKSGWCKLHLDGVPYGVFTNHRTGDKISKAYPKTRSNWQTRSEEHTSELQSPDQLV